MVKPKIGQVISTTFPFSDLSSNKFRPALVVAHADFNNVILCQITSKQYSSSNPVPLLTNDFTEGNLPINSYIRPDKLFTADLSIIKTVHGQITSKKLEEVHIVIRSLFTV